LLVQYPFLEGLLAEAEAGRRATSSSCVGSHGLEVSDVVNSDDFSVEAVFEELRARRELLPEGDGVGEVYFRVRILGGRWTMERKGVAFDRYKGEVRAGSLAADWCEASGMRSGCSYIIAKFGDVGAQVLASSWCEMMLYDFELASGCVDGTHVYDEDAGPNRPACERLRAIYPELPRGDAQARARAVLDMGPPQAS